MSSAYDIDEITSDIRTEAAGEACNERLEWSMWWEAPMGTGEECITIESRVA